MSKALIQHAQMEAGLSRRELLRRGLLGTAGWFVCAGARGAQPAIAPTATAGTSPRAKSVIQIWLWGGPCHIDTFDPKPEAGRDYCGPLTKPLETNVSGLRISELLPQLARHADKYSIIRSMTHGSNAHETGAYITQTGFDPGDRIVHPSAGAVVALFRGEQRGAGQLLPPYIVLTEPQGRFSEAGFLGSRYKPFATGGDPARPKFAVEGLTAEGLSPERQTSRRELLRSLDTLGRSLQGDPALAQYAQSREAAEHIARETARYYALDDEPAALRDRYGRNTFGQACLVARRLVEQGVPFVTINYRGWDTHHQHFEAMRRKLPELDSGVATLLQDLGDRGLLDSTMVWCGGEFGRTPKVLWEAPWNGGRGHYGACFSTLIAGGGIKGGQVVGASDGKGEEVAERPVHPRELLARIYTQQGIDPTGPLPNDKGLDATVLPPATDQQKGPLDELV